MISIPASGLEGIFMTKTAIMGGTFNPVHYGHLRAAEEVREHLGLDKVLFVPTYLTPHKADEMVMPAQMRLDMVRLAVEGNPGFEASDIEIRRAGKSFTIDTVRELKASGKGLKLSLIIGNDSFNDITTWCEYEELVSLTGLIIVTRPNYPVKKPAEVLPVELARKFWYDSTTESYLNPEGGSLTYLETTLMDISASDIRARVKNESSIKYLLPQSVIDYINRKGLYR